ncbi:phosphate acyltransferase PlsX [Siminovitchia sp. FSL H7-0308]|uniref:Phosphate acyltransferase n=1 Tax=Siminovitchia thermophila TaxID=1245522 RepID=A0ABS2R7L0_9BACI|nr:phosphate acyltransferase PlsX [Siminovitchia thermophila]MBM7715632.1 glycerol-3-phosphate acyltransferase PlsX [Siminovitchia thermophila]ONK23270.1 phosphate acyltransferase [Bacillus sp. VT-16-64]
MKIAIDAMGGDHAPREIVRGVEKAAKDFTDAAFTLYGNEKDIQQYLTSHERIEIVHTTEVIGADDEPVRAVRRKKEASMVKMAQAVADGQADACISAGNTGALMASGLFIVGRIKGVERPALAPTLPTIDGKGFVMLDLGANVDAKPEHLLQYAYMGKIYAENVRKIENPRVALLNIGSEQNKGNDLTKKTYDLLKKANVNFTGNIEARELLEGHADVVVTDGFTGNVVLKAIEGTAASLFSMLKKTMTKSVKNKLAAGIIKGDLLELKDQMDYTEYGGACLFGLESPVIKAHGSSNANAVYHAIRQAFDIVKNDVTGTIKANITEQNG